MSKTTNAHGKQFMVSAESLQRLDSPKFGESGSEQVHVEVQGYFSSSVMTLYINREIDFAAWTRANKLAILEGEKPGAVSCREFANWLIKLTHSSGGRDKNEVEDDLEAEANFAQALTWLAQFGQTLRLKVDVLEQAFQAHQAELTEAAAKQRAEAEAAIAADPALGHANAVRIMAAAVEMARKVGSHVFVARPRGGATSRQVSRSVEVATTMAGARWRIAGRPASRHEVLMMLSEASSQTNLD